MDIIMNYVVPLFGGITLTGIFSAIIYAILKSAFTKLLSKINMEKTVEKATDKSIAKIKDVTLKQNIQPIVVSELKKVTETASEFIKGELAEVQSQYKNVINVLKKLSAYFDNSIGVPDEAKQELKEALQQAEDFKGKQEQIIESTIVVEEKKSTAKTQKTTATNPVIEGER